MPRAGRSWLRCTGLSSLLPGTPFEVAFHDFDNKGTIDLGMADLQQTYGSLLVIESRRGAHLISFDLCRHEIVQATQDRNIPNGQDPDHAKAHSLYGRSVLRINQKYEAPDLHFLHFHRNRHNTAPWSGPHWDFYRSLLNHPIPPPGPIDQRIDGTGQLTLEVYYTPAPDPWVLP